MIFMIWGCTCLIINLASQTWPFIDGGRYWVNISELSIDFWRFLDIFAAFCSFRNNFFANRNQSWLIGVRTCWCCCCCRRILHDLMFAYSIDQMILQKIEAQLWKTNGTMRQEAAPSETLGTRRKVKWRTPGMLTRRPSVRRLLAHILFDHASLVIINDHSSQSCS